MMKPRRLKGHKKTVTCCIASRTRPGLIATSSEDGCICWFDMRCKDVVFTMDLDKKPISSICFNQGNEDILYACSGTEVISFDVNMASSWKPLETYNHNKEEINQISCNSKSSFLAAADDSGGIKIIDIRQHCLYKTLRSGHTSICSSVQFLPWRPWEVITGGLDAKLVMWDFSKGRPCKIMDFGLPDMESHGSGGQCFNPAFIHAVAIPEVDMLDKSGKVCAVARGDGVVDVIDIESEIASSKLKSSIRPRTGSQSSSGNVKPAATTTTLIQESGKRLHLDNSLGGHTAAVSCVSFSLFAERGRYIISGGNDASVKVWDWSKHRDAVETSRTNLLVQNISLSKKVNWLCTTPSDSENLVVCDTSKVVKVYTVT
ncbi:hypothetical protein IFM89_028434 [Coptis chinensis]|uniref:Uncharacterized protein n=1 Tax=Coptis chinensis TaxID=261450 RepID=A0A835IQD7_9MAGN|nr:hypothetical protein IFM89_028434 [Coptis chinensis]